MDLTELSFVAVFLTGLLGGVHCAGMCGGIVSALGMMQRPVGRGVTAVPVRVLSPGIASNGIAARTQTALGTVALYNAGRIVTYTLLGSVSGAVGSLAWLMHSVMPVQRTAFFISNLLLIIMGLYVFGFRRLALLLESMGSGVWKHIRPVATSRLRTSGSLNAFFAGGLWGLVPCGMVYAVLSAALVSGSALRGAMLMLVFGLGTLPNLMLLGLSGQWLARASKHVWVRRFAGTLIMIFGLLGMMHLAMMGHT